MVLLLNQTFTSGELQVECVVESSAIGGGGAYIGAEGSLHQLGKVGLEQMDGRPSTTFMP
jgi:hypothetical protein